MAKPSKRPALGRDMFAPHPVDLYTKPATAPASSAVVKPAARRTRRNRPQLNALMDSWQDVDVVRAHAFVERVDLKVAIMRAFAAYDRTVSVAQRRAYAAAAAQLAAARPKGV